VTDFPSAVGRSVFQVDSQEDKTPKTQTQEHTLFKVGGTVHSP